MFIVKGKDPFLKVRIGIEKKKQTNNQSNNMKFIIIYKSKNR